MTPLTELDVIDTVLFEDKVSGKPDFTIFQSIPGVENNP